MTISFLVAIFHVDFAVLEGVVFTSAPRIRAPTLQAEAHTFSGFGPSYVPHFITFLIVSFFCAFFVSVFVIFLNLSLFLFFLVFLHIFQNLCFFLKNFLIFIIFCVFLKLGRGGQPKPQTSLGGVNFSPKPQTSLGFGVGGREVTTSPKPQTSLGFVEVEGGGTGNYPQTPNWFGVWGERGEGGRRGVTTPQTQTHPSQTSVGGSKETRLCLGGAAGLSLTLFRLAKQSCHFQRPSRVSLRSSSSR